MDIMLRKALWGFLRPLLQLVTNMLSPEVGAEWEEELKKFNRREPCWVVTAKAAVAKKAEETKVYLRRLFSAVPVGAADGTETFANSPLFGNGARVYGTTLPVAEVPTLTPATTAGVSELVENGKFVEFLGSPEGVRPRWNQSQVCDFARTHPDKLRKGGYATFFELEGGFVAGVLFDGRGRLGVRVRGLSIGSAWSAECRHRVVLLATEI